MPIRQLATDNIFFRRNDEAIDEFARLGFALPDQIARVLKIVDGRRTFKQVVSHPTVLLDETSTDSVRSLIKLGFIEAMPVPQADAATQQITLEAAHLNATQRLRVIAAASEPNISQTQAMQALNSTPAEREAWQRDVEARQLEEIKASLIGELRQVLGRDVELIQTKILAVNSAEGLLNTVGVCSRILEMGISKDVADKFVAAFKQHFIS
jgi:hypothetical protein